MCECMCVCTCVCIWVWVCVFVFVCVSVWVSVVSGVHVCACVFCKGMRRTPESDATCFREPAHASAKLLADGAAALWGRQGRGARRHRRTGVTAAVGQSKVVGDCLFLYFSVSLAWRLICLADR